MKAKMRTASVMIICLVLSVLSKICNTIGSQHYSDDPDKLVLLRNLSEALNDPAISTSRSAESYMHHCPDSFGTFGFLAFLLALVDLSMKFHDKGMTMTTDRKKREAQPSSIQRENKCQEKSGIREAFSASFSLLRGFQNALNSDEPECARMFFCQGVQEAASLGPLGEIYARLGSVNAQSWLMKINSSHFSEFAAIGKDDTLHSDCSIRYPRCRKSSKLFKNFVFHSSLDEEKYMSFILNIFENPNEVLDNRN